jgi:hypothetical protein
MDRRCHGRIRGQAMTLPRKLSINWTLGGPNCIQSLVEKGQLEERKAQVLTHFRAFLAEEERIELEKISTPADLSKPL